MLAQRQCVISYVSEFSSVGESIPMLTAGDISLESIITNTCVSFCPKLDELYRNFLGRALVMTRDFACAVGFEGGLKMYKSTKMDNAVHEAPMASVV